MIIPSLRTAITVGFNKLFGSDSDGPIGIKVSAYFLLRRKDMHTQNTNTSIRGANVSWTKLGVKKKKITFHKTKFIRLGEPGCGKLAM